MESHHQHIHLHLEPGPGLDKLLHTFQAILQEMRLMSAELDRLTTEVSENTTVIESAIALIEGLAQQIRDNATDPASLTALADSLDSESNKLGAAVAANTPQPQPPAPTPEPT